MARNLAELLPARFEELTREHVREIIERIGDPRETLFFERKRQVSGDSLAKACAAFANTMGGLLVVGIADDDDELVGTEAGSSEAQLWVKDTLRGLVTPMPPFRARRLDIGDDRGILLVLVEESTATPHLLARNGAIYVRNPGSSDPLPLTDQRRLFDLAARGERAESGADELAEGLRQVTWHDGAESRKIECVSLAATGVSAEYEAGLFAPGMPEQLASFAWTEPITGQEQRWPPAWAPDSVGIFRKTKHRDPFSPVVDEGLTVHRRGAAATFRGIADRDPSFPETLELPDLRRRFLHDLRACRRALASLGAHGRLRIVYGLHPGDERYVDFGGRHEKLPGVRVARWISFDGDDDALADDVFAEVRRAAGFGPLS